jgi:hypothetical protein
MRLCFVIHGMGVHGDDWASEVLAKLNEVAARYPAVADRGGALDEQVTFVPITYDEEFTQHLEEFTGSAEELDTFAKANAVNLPDIIGFLQTASATERNFFWSHVVDVLLYRFFQLITIPVRLRVMKQIVTAWSKALEEGDLVEASVMAHSLGTSVTHDALAFLGTTPFEDSEAFMVGNRRFTNLFMVANVGRILETAHKCFASCVHPLSVRPDDAYCSRYYNFRHRLDPFPAVRAFSPVGWGEDFHTSNPELDHLHDFNVHGFRHYLYHPAVHVPIINGLLGFTIDNATRDQAIAEYPRVKTANPCLAKVAAAEVRFQGLVNLLKTSENPIQLIIAGAQFFAAAKEAKDACI